MIIILKLKIKLKILKILKKAKDIFFIKLCKTYNFSIKRKFLTEIYNKKNQNNNNKNYYCTYLNIIFTKENITTINIKICKKIFEYIKSNIENKKEYTFHNYFYKSLIKIIIDPFTSIKNINYDILSKLYIKLYPKNNTILDKIQIHGFIYKKLSESKISLSKDDLKNIFREDKNHNIRSLNADIYFSEKFCNDYIKYFNKLIDSLNLKIEKLNKPYLKICNSLYKDYNNIHIKTNFNKKEIITTNKYYKWCESMYYILKNAINIDIIFGEAGTGKTHDIIEEIKKNKNNEIFILAFTGKAVSVIRKRLKNEKNLENKDNIKTIDSFIYCLKNNKNTINSGDNVIIIIIDEISMISIKKFVNLFNEIPNYKKYSIFLVGDLNQLPPIKNTEGNFIHELKSMFDYNLFINNDYMNKWNFTDKKEILRTDTNSMVVKTYKDLRRPYYFKKIIVSNLIGKVYDYKIQGNIDINDNLHLLSSKNCKEDDFYKNIYYNINSLYENQILTFTNKNVKYHNIKIQSFLIKEKFLNNKFIYKDKNKSYYKGDKIICTKNIDDKVFNGSIGEIIEILKIPIMCNCCKNKLEVKNIDDFPINFFTKLQTEKIDTNTNHSYLDITNIQNKNKENNYFFPKNFFDNLKLSKYGTLWDYCNPEKQCKSKEYFYVLALKIKFTNDERIAYILNTSFKKYINNILTIDDIILSYCITVHKSQGSQYPIVGYISQNENYGYTSLYYTAFTRMGSCNKDVKDMLYIYYDDNSRLKKKINHDEINKYFITTYLFYDNTINNINYVNNIEDDVIKNDNKNINKKNESSIFKNTPNFFKNNKDKILQYDEYIKGIISTHDNEIEYAIMND